MKTILLNPIRCFCSLSFILVAVLLTCYSTAADARRGGKPDASSATEVVAAAEKDDDPEYVEKRHEFLNRFFGTGPGGVSPEAYTNALIAARALPQSPLLEGRSFIPAETQQATRWSSPIAPPIQNSYGGSASAMIHALAIDPMNANVVYTGSFGGLAKTTDGGVTWRYLSDEWASQSVSSITVHPRASNDVYVGTGRENCGSYSVGLYRSFDAGTTWSSPLGGDHFAGTHVRTIAIDPNASASEWATTLYVANGASDNSGLWRSTDSGTTWRRLRHGSHRSLYNGVYDVAIDNATVPSVIYVTDDDGTFKSSDSGNSWTPIHAVIGNAPNHLSVVNSALYVLGPGDPEHNLYKSMDRGATWVQIPTHCPGPDSCANGFSVFAVDPANSQIILAGNIALYRTENEGASWKEIGHWWGPAIHTDQKVIAFSPTAPGLAYDGNDGGVVRSTDTGLRWTNLNQNLPGALLYSVALSGDGSMIAGTQDNGVVFSSAGAPWDMVTGGDSYYALIDPRDSISAYFVIYRPDSFTRLNTQTHQSANISPVELEQDAACNFFPPFSMNQSSPKHLLAACQHVVRTLDGTASPVVWTTIGGSLADPSKPNEWWNSVSAAYQAPSNSNVIYAVSSWGKVWVTENADQGNSATWMQRTTGTSGGIHAVTVHPTDPQTAYLACDSGMYKTTNMGRTWTRHGLNVIYHDVAVDPVNPEHIFAASNAGVFASADGGVSWANMSEGIPAGLVVTGLSLNTSSRQLAAATYGRGVYMLNLETQTRTRPTPRFMP